MKTCIETINADLLEACKITLRLMKEYGQTHENPTDAAYMDMADTGLSSPLSAVLENVIDAADAFDSSNKRPKITLKPCPYCGGEAVMSKRERFDIPNWVEFYIGCDRHSCKVMPHVKSFGGYKEAVQAWNRRAGVDQESPL